MLGDAAIGGIVILRYDQVSLSTIQNSAFSRSRFSIFPGLDITRLENSVLSRDWEEEEERKGRYFWKMQKRTTRIHASGLELKDSDFSKGSKSTINDKR